MDERLEKALDFSNYMITLNNQKRILKEQFREQIIFYHKGAQFTVTKELITFANMLVEREHVEDVVLVDDNEVPVMVHDLVEFLNDIMDVYFSATNSLLTKYEEIKRNRSVEKLTEYE
jgi:hypothetical protein